jgi:signal peptidase I
MSDDSPVETRPEDPDPPPAAPADASPEAPADETADAARPAPRRRRRRGSFLRELPVLLIIAFGLAVLIKTFLVQAFFIPSGSMERTLHGCPGCSGDRVLVNKLTYRFREPRPGDIVVFRGGESWAPEAQFAQPSNPVQRVFRAIGSAIGVAPPGEKDFIKRVIAVGGQVVQCCDAHGRVIVDGHALNEPYVYISDTQGYRPTPFGPVTVPKGRLWVMGDHRDQSADSRAHISDPDQGTVSSHDVIGKAFVIVWPPSRWATLGNPATFATATTVGGDVVFVAPLTLGLGAALPRVVRRRRRRRR